MSPTDDYARALALVPCVTKDILSVWFVPDKSRSVPLFALTMWYLTLGSGNVAMVGCVADPASVIPNLK